MAGKKKEPVGTLVNSDNGEAYAKLLEQERLAPRDARLDIIRDLRAMGAIHASVDGISATWPTALLQPRATPADEAPPDEPKTLAQKRRAAQEEFERTLFHSS